MNDEDRDEILPKETLIACSAAELERTKYKCHLMMNRYNCNQLQYHSFTNNDSFEYSFINSFSSANINFEIIFVCLLCVFDLLDVLVKYMHPPRCRHSHTHGSKEFLLLMCWWIRFATHCIVKMV